MLCPKPCLGSKLIATTEELNTHHIAVILCSGWGCRNLCLWVTILLGFPGGSVVKNLTCRRPRFNPWVEKIPWRKKWQPTPVFLPGKFHGQRSLVGYRPQGCKESDANERLNYHNSLTKFMKLILSKLRTVGTGQSQMTASVSNSILMSSIL